MKLKSIKILYTVSQVFIVAAFALGIIFLNLGIITLTEFVRGILVFLSAFSIVIIPLSLSWWRQIDEAAKEAHKEAWFWGGNVGILAAVFLATINILTGNKVLPIIIGDYPDLKNLAFEIGVLETLCFASFGYTVHWADWWWRRR